MSCKEQIMSKDKYPSIFFAPNGGYCVFCHPWGFVGNITWIFSSFSWGIFRHMTCLDQSHARENILWIITQDIRTVGTASDWLIANLGTVMRDIRLNGQKFL